MDPVSFAASLITLVEVSSRVIAYLQNVQQGGRTREKLLEELTVLSFILRSFKTDLDPPPLSADEPWMQPLRALVEPEGHGVLDQIRQELTGLETRLAGNSARVRKAWSTLRWPFEEKQALETVARVNRLKDTTILVLSQSSHQLNRDIISSVKHLTSAAEDEQFQNVLNWLSPFNFRQKQQEIRGTAESFPWILQDKRFMSWQVGDAPLLWCHGPPGAGKSVLAASLFDEIIRGCRDYQKVAVLVGFCSFDNENYQTPESVVASLLKQVAQTRGRLSSELKEEHSQSLRQDGKTPELSKLKALFRKELEEFEETFIIFDGLDEASNENDRAAIVATLHTLKPSAKVLITSRFSEDIATSINNAMRCQRCLSDETSHYWRCTMCENHVLCEGCRNNAVESDDPDRRHRGVRQSSSASIPFRPREADIRKYVRMRIETDSGLKRIVDSPELGASIVSTVVTKSEKLFLLARLHMDSLADCFTVFELRQQLSALSGDLPGIYAQALQRLRRSRSHAQQKMLDKMLKWVSWAKRPLSLQELGHALSIVPGLGSISKDLILPTETIRDITTWTAGLIFVDAWSLVRFTHPTTARFFYQQRESLFPKGDAELARICFDYLQIFQVRAPLPEKDKSSHFHLRTRQYPLLEYAILCGWQHVARSATKDDDLQATMFLQFQECRDFLDSAQGSILMRVVDENNPDMAQFLIDKGADMNQLDFLGRNVLHSAAINRAWACLEVLLKQPAAVDVNCQGRHGETPLHDACKTRDPTGAQLLVTAGARCDLRNSDGHTPVDIARLNQAIDTLRILETAKGYRDPPATRTAKSLLDAVVSDTTEVLKEMIKKASIQELNAASAFYGPPLSRASSCGRALVVRMLLEAGADTEPGINE